jgi:CHAD domain-containing protein
VHGLRRLAAKNLRAAADELERISQSSDEEIHDARKRVKKVRAIAHLVRKDDGRHLSGSRRELRKVNRRLAPVRDAAATLEILEKIRDSNPTVVSEHTFARVRRMLDEHKAEIVRVARHDRAFDKAAKKLRHLEKESKRWRPRHDEFEAISAGMRATHRRARRAMRRALETDVDEHFHEWRKEVKVLWYALRLLAASGDSRIRRDIATLTAVETMLGDDHNVAVLCDCLTPGTATLAPPDLEALRAAAARYQRDLRRKAIAKARPIFKARSKDYVRRIERAWNRSRREPSDGQRAPAA